MNPATLINQAEEDGVRLALSDTGTLKASGDKSHIDKWLPVIRAHKVGLIALLSFAANDPTPDLTPRYGWLIHFTDREPVYATYSPEATHAEVLRGYPDAVAAVPTDSAPSGERYGVTAPTADPDDRITCRQCENFTYSGICTIARPGGPVSAQKGYRIAGADMRQRCPAFQPIPLKGTQND